VIKAHQHYTSGCGRHQITFPYFTIEHCTKLPWSVSQVTSFDNGTFISYVSTQNLWHNVHLTDPFLNIQASEHCSGSR
jgi:hypothetical protein